MSKISERDIESLLELFERSDWRELHVWGEGIDLFVSKDPQARRPKARTGDGAAARARAPQTGARAAGPEPARTDASAARPPADVPAHWIPVRAPCLGTFYLAPKPGAPPFVALGQRVTPETEICLVEVMKLFTTVRAGVTGIVRKLPVADAELVEFDQPLIYIEPDA